MKLHVGESGLPQLDQLSEEGFVDCVFAVEDLARSAGHYAFRMAAEYEGQRVAVGVRVVRGIKAGFDQHMSPIPEHVYRSGVVLHRIGLESDRLVAVLSSLYRLSIPPRRMAETVPFTGIALHQGSIDVDTEVVKLKLFGHEDDGEALYNETYLSLDLPNGLAFWNEKDEAYRAPLVRSLWATASA